MTKKRNFHLFSRGFNKDYHVIDKNIAEWISIWGCLLHCYKYLGPKTSPEGSDVDTTAPTFDENSKESDIGDTVLLENASRRYSKEVYDFWAAFQMNQNNFDLMQLALIQDDTKEINFHYNEMIERLGRKIIPGDVFEFTFMRDMDLVGSDEAINKFYVVEDVSRPEDGFSPTWRNHLWRVRAKPLTNSPEFADIFNRDPDNGSDNFYGGGGANGTNLNTELSIMNDLLDQADYEVAFVNNDEHNLWVDIDESGYLQLYCEQMVTMGNDGIPANVNYQDVDKGDFFPNEWETGDFFLRTDYQPNRLFYRNEDYWRMIEIDNRQRWTGVPLPLQKAINNKDTYIDENNQEQESRRGLSTVLRAKSDKEGNSTTNRDSYNVD